MGLDVELKRGSSGQFDVLADGELVASRDGGFLAKLFRGGWPDPHEVVNALHRRGMS